MEASDCVVKVSQLQATLKCKKKRERERERKLLK